MKAQDQCVSKCISKTQTQLRVLAHSTSPHEVIRKAYQKRRPSATSILLPAVVLVLQLKQRSDVMRATPMRSVIVRRPAVMGRRRIRSDLRGNEGYREEPSRIHQHSEFCVGCATYHRSNRESRMGTYPGSRKMMTAVRGTGKISNTMSFPSFPLHLRHHPPRLNDGCRLGGHVVSHEAGS